jgi:hypothetical protein
VIAIVPPNRLVRQSAPIASFLILDPNSISDLRCLQNPSCLAIGGERSTQDDLAG